MARTVAEAMVRTRRFGPKVLVRVDLHGVSVFGPSGERTLVRWEWIEAIEVTTGVEVRSASARLLLPRRAFGRSSEDLAERLEAARSITQRADVIEELAGPAA